MDVSLRVMMDDFIVGIAKDILILLEKAIAFSPIDFHCVMLVCSNKLERHV